MPLHDDDQDGGGLGRRLPSLNVLGGRLETCSIRPMTGFFRNGCCDTSAEDFGSHTVCVETTAEFLAFSKSRGNDLSTPMPAFGFAGLKPGERTGGGSPDWLADQAPAKQHAAAVERLLAAGADIIGKTVCEEFFFSLTGANIHYGTPVNVRAPGRLPGGSSSGSAAAVAAG